jgi:hypothetical protein
VIDRLHEAAGTNADHPFKAGALHQEPLHGGYLAENFPIINFFKSPDAYIYRFGHRNLLILLNFKNMQPYFTYQSVIIHIK